MNDNSKSNEIRKRMAQIRCELDDDVGAVVKEAKELADWRNFVRRYPILSIAGSAAVGFLVVPKRLNVMSPDPETLEKLAKRNRLVVKPKSEVRKQSGIAAPLVTFLATTILRSAVAIAGHQLGAMVSQHPNGSSNESDSTTAESRKKA